MLTREAMEAYLTPERRETLLAYCQLREEDMSPAESDLFTAMTYAVMARLGIPVPGEDNPDRYSYDMAINAAVLDSWDRRGELTEGQLKPNPVARSRETGLGIAYG